VKFSRNTMSISAFEKGLNNMRWCKMLATRIDRNRFTAADAKAASSS
jgi:hypothetical protein